MPTLLHAARTQACAETGVRLLARPGDSLDNESVYFCYFDFLHRAAVSPSLSWRGPPHTPTAVFWCESAKMQATVFQRSSPWPNRPSH